MSEVDQLATFAHSADISQMSDKALSQLKIRILDTLGVAIGALDAKPIRAMRTLLADLGGAEDATAIGGGKLPADRAAFFNCALSRYLDFMDSYLAKGETNHPSDNFGAVLACAEQAGASGAELLSAFAVAIQVHTRLSDVAPVRARGFDHTVQGAYAAAAGAGKALGLDVNQLANAIAIAGTANNALRVTRTGDLSHWKGLAYPNVSKEAVFAALLASRGITGPNQVFEGNKGLKDTITGPFELDWSQEDLERVCDTIIKKHNAEIHSQSALDAAIELHHDPAFDASKIERVDLITFDVAYSIIGGGEEGDKRNIRTKEEADHSLPWMVAVTLLDGELNPAQYEPERIVADDVQSLMAKVRIREDAEFSDRFPAHMPADLTITMADGTKLHAHKDSYRGFHDDPLTWEDARKKFDALTTPFTSADLREQIADVVANLEDHTTADLTALLANVSSERS